MTQDFVVLFLLLLVAVFPGGTYFKIMIERLYLIKS